MNTATVKIKPLSVNKAWKGRRFKTDEYKNYEAQLLLMLPNDLVIENGFLDLLIEFGFSNSASDIDNGVKPFVDILQKKYGFNDNRIYKMTLVKTKVEKGCEFISFRIFRLKGE